MSWVLYCYDCVGLVEIKNIRISEYAPPGCIRHEYATMKIIKIDELHKYIMEDEQKK